MTAYPARERLYTAEELLEGFDPDSSLGFTQTRDFSMFRRYVLDGESAPRSLEVRQQQNLHDAGISWALGTYLEQKSPALVGVMGGHKVARDDPAYRQVALLSRRLTQERFLIATGGGPGAMEAAHLGAAFANADAALLDRACEVLKEHPELPDLSKSPFNSDGSIEPEQKAVLEAANHWLVVALAARDLCPSPRGASLAIPTWRYGQEPTTPFATEYAKYFQNSIREEALVAKSLAGIVFAQGGGGTLREIFQDVEENYYAANAAQFTPMIFSTPMRTGRTTWRSTRMAPWVAALSSSTRCSAGSLYWPAPRSVTHRRAWRRSASPSISMRSWSCCMPRRTPPRGA